MQNKRILILGGTGLARQAADALVDLGHDVTTSLAGVTHSPHLGKGEVITGGFGGVEGLHAYLAMARFDLVVDATHAFAAQMATHAVVACQAEKVELVRLEAAAWEKREGDLWQEVVTIANAVEALPPQAKVVVTVGRKQAGAFLERADLSGVIRMIEAPPMPIPNPWHLILERPPCSLESEIDLLRATGADYLVSKNSGGPRPAKLDAAATLGIPVIMIKRPTKPAADTVNTVAELLALVRA